MPTEVTNLVKIGELSKSTGLPVKTIRYYEDLDLIHAVKRTQGGFRLFDEKTTVIRLQFIRQAQTLGMSLDEIREFLEVRDRGELPCHDIKDHLEDKVVQIEEQIEALKHLQCQIKLLLAGADPILETPPDERICPIIQPEDY